jgi:hypothetical protein
VQVAWPAASVMASREGLLDRNGPYVRGTATAAAARHSHPAARTRTIAAADAAGIERCMLRPLIDSQLPWTPLSGMSTVGATPRREEHLRHLAAIRPEYWA